MNAAILTLFGILWLAFAYVWYGGIIRRRVVQPNDAIPTPSQTVNDGIDYVPTKTPILFGHHFSSIAGAGPIIGPILAFALFGWLPAVIWILLGTVFMGAVHDYTSLMASVRNRGVSIVEITERAVSKSARTIFALFVWLALALVQAVFADLTAKTIVEKPEIAIPTVSVIFLAVAFGWAVYRKGFNLVAGTIVALAILYGMIELGNAYPLIASYHVWLAVMILYSFIAAVIPVWVLLQPRDYISMYILVIGLVMGFIGIMVLQPTITGPAFISFDSTNGPLFPILFITVACGAVSGFHSLVSSGTSSKQLRRESDGMRVAYGGMLTEGALALLVVMMIASVLVWNPNGGAVSGFVFQDLLKQSANIVFGTALGQTISSLGIPLAAGIAFGVLMLNAFILTTLDTTVRLSRYIVQETLGVRYGGLFANKYFAAAASLILAYGLCLGDGYKALWPVFGASNQLIAALALFVVTAYWFGFKRPKWYTLAPGIFMLLATESALIYQTFWLYIPQAVWHLAVISFVLMLLGFIVAFEVYKRLRMKQESVVGAFEAGTVQG